MVVLGGSRRREVYAATAAQYVGRRCPDGSALGQYRRRQMGRDQDPRMHCTHAKLAIIASRQERSGWQRKPVILNRFIPSRMGRGSSAVQFFRLHRHAQLPSARGRIRNTPRDRIPISKASSLQSHSQMGVVMRGWYKSAGTRSVRACLRSVAGHAGATADLELTFNTDHPVGADQYHHCILLLQLALQFDEA
jgi:hypothetical protein